MLARAGLSVCQGADGSAGNGVLALAQAWSRAEKGRKIKVCYSDVSICIDAEGCGAVPLSRALQSVCVDTSGRDGEQQPVWRNAFLLPALHEGFERDAAGAVRESEWWLSAGAVVCELARQGYLAVPLGFAAVREAAERRVADACQASEDLARLAHGFLEVKL